MNEQDRPDQQSEHDPVAELFARERSQVRPAPADDLHWQRIVREASRRRRLPFLAYSAGALAAAAAVLAFVLAGGLLHGPVPNPATTVSTTGSGGLASHSAAGSTTGVPSRTSSRSGSLAPSGSPGSPGSLGSPGSGSSASELPSSGTPTVLGHSAQPTGSPTPTDRAWVTPVPGHFAATSLTNAGGGVLYAVGNSVCGGRACPILVGSRDAGGSWTLVASFPQDGAAGQTVGVYQVQPARTLSQVRFANSRDGWVFGGGLRYTRDGGVHWAAYQHAGGEVVLGLETDGTQVFIATTSRCGATSCSGPLVVLAADVAATRATTVVYRGPSAAGLQGAQIASNRNGTYVSPVGTPALAGRYPAPIRASGGAAAPLGTNSGCGQGSYAPVVATNATVGGSLVESCRVPTSDNHSLDLRVSTGAADGTAWRTTGSLTLAGGALTQLAAVDDRHFVAISGGGTSDANTLAVTTDAGASWHGAATLPTGTGAGWSWVGAASSRTYYLLPARPTRAYWKSTDAGRTWTQVGFGG